jgi:CD2 antigen cytoplasmic tail-binding protein 2
LDLDTLGRTGQKSRRLKEGVYSESENEFIDDDEEDEKEDKDAEIPPPKIDSASGDEDEDEQTAVVIDDMEEEEDDDVRIEPFNMKAEREEGRFDEEEQNYIRNIDEEEHQDNWLQGIGRRDIQRAREAELKRQQRLQQESSEKPEESIRDLVVALRGYLLPGESVMQAIQRRNAGLTVRRVGQKKMQLREEQQRLESQKRAEIEQITEVATKLLTAGMSQIYDETPESLKL